MSGIGTGTALLIGGLGAAGASLGGAALSSSAAGSAAKSQSNAADYAAQLQYQASQNALDFQKQQYGQSQQNIAPWLQTGGGALSNLAYLMGVTPNTSIGQPLQTGSIGGQTIPHTPGGTPSPVGGPVTPGTLPTGSNGAIGGTGTLPGGASGGVSPRAGVSPVGLPANGSPGMTAPQTMSAPSPTGGPIMNTTANEGNPNASSGFGSLMTPYSGQFTAPTDITMQNDPGYQARMTLGTDALQHSAAARGSLLTGGTAKALDTYAQDYASNEYSNVYNRAYNDYATKYNAYNNNQNNQFNRLAALSGVGQTAGSQLAQAGQLASNNISSNLLGTAAGMGQQYNNAAAANASGIVGSANAWGGALGSTGNNLSQLLMLQQLYGGGSGGGPSFDGNGLAINPVTGSGYSF